MATKIIDSGGCYAPSGKADGRHGVVVVSEWLCALAGAGAPGRYSGWYSAIAATAGGTATPAVGRTGKQPDRMCGSGGCGRSARSSASADQSPEQAGAEPDRCHPGLCKQQLSPQYAGRLLRREAGGWFDRMDLSDPAGASLPGPR